MRRRKLHNKTDPSKEKEKDKDQQITCYGCNKSGHYRNKYPQLKKATKSNKKKAMVSLWEEVTSLALTLKKKMKKLPTCVS